MLLSDLILARLDNDRDELRTYCGISKFEWISRLVLLFFGSAAFFYLLNDPGFMIWWGAYFIVTAANFAAARRFAIKQSGSRYLTYLATDIADSVLSVIIYTYLWTYGDPVLQSTALIYAAGSLLYVFAGRLRVPTLAWIDLGYFQALLTVSWLWLIITGETDAIGIALIVALIVLQTYHLFTIREVLHSNKEIDQTRRRALQAQRLEAVGRLTGGIAHDFNNILTVILGNLELYDEIEDPNERRELIGECRAAAVRASTLTS